jgi:hypothetical protein
VIKFWEDNWIGKSSLKQAFPQLFSLSLQQMGLISDTGVWQKGVWVWRFTWGRELITLEEPMVRSLGEVLQPLVLRRVVIIVGV